MAKAAMIFNGIRFSFEVANRAISWAKQHDASLVAVFLKAKKEVKEGYIFPSDLDVAENLSSTEDAEISNIRVIESNILILEHQATSENVELHIQLLTDPTIEELSQQLTGCEILFMQENVDEPGILSVESIDLKKLQKHPPVPIEIVH